MMALDLLERSDVRVSRNGFVEAKAHGGYIVGLVSAATGPAGNSIWKAQACDMGSWSHTRNGAIAEVLKIWNVNEKAAAFDRMT